PFMKSSRSSAVVFGSTVTGLSSGAGGVFTVAQSATMSPAQAGCAAAIVTTANAAPASPRVKFTAKVIMVPSLGYVDLARHFGEPMVFLLARTSAPCVTCNCAKRGPDAAHAPSGPSSQLTRTEATSCDSREALRTTRGRCAAHASDTNSG